LSPSDHVLAFLRARLERHRKRWTKAAISAHYAVNTVLMNLIEDIEAGKHLPEPIPSSEIQAYRDLQAEIEAGALTATCPWCCAQPGEPCFTKTPCLPHEWRYERAGVSRRPKIITDADREEALTTECPDCHAPAGMSCADFQKRLDETP
jgi:hypothetical protein